MSDLDIFAAVGLERAELRLEEIKRTEEGARRTIEEAKSYAPQNDAERAQHRARETAVSAIVPRKLQGVSAVCGAVPDVVSVIDGLSRRDQITVLRNQLAPILHMASEAARVLALSLDACEEIDAAIERGH